MLSEIARSWRVPRTVTRALPVAAMAAAIASCATVPTPLRGEFASEMPRDVVQAGSTGAAPGETVRWGGEIIDVKPEADRTCFEVLARPLDSSARPTTRDPSGGRFIACRSGFYDPEEFRHGRDLTVVGHLDGTITGKVGEFDYTYPRVAADTVYLWPKRPLYTRSPYYYDPWLNDPFLWGPYWGPYWGAPIIVRPAPRPNPPPPPSRG